MTASRKLLLPGIAAAVVLTRLPLLLTGYGADGDAWRIAYVAKQLWTTGIYEMSRPPGYPAYELLSAPLVALGGAFLSNLATLIASIAAIVMFFRIVLTTSQRPALVSATFAFAPLLWVNSAVTMDYVWSLLMILLAVQAVMRGRHIMAGIMAGIAVGFRPSNGVLLLPLMMLLASATIAGATSSPLRGPEDRGNLMISKGPLRLLRRVAPRNDSTLGAKVMGFLGAAVLTTTVLFLPILFTCGLSGWLAQVHAQYGSVAPGWRGAVGLFAYRAAYAIGPLAVVSCLWIVFRKGALKNAWKAREPLFLTSIIALCVLCATFALFPLEKSYLLPGLPFLIIVIDRLATPRAFAVFALCLVSFAFVNPDIVRHGGVRGTPGVNVHAGIVLEEWQQRKELAAWRIALAHQAAASQTVVMTGAGPAFWFENDAVERVDNPVVREVNDVVVQRKGDASMLFVPMIPRREEERMRSMGWNVVIDEKNREYIEQMRR